MDLIQPGPLLPDHAIGFARSEISRRELPCNAADRESCAEARSASVGHVAFYIRKLVARLPRNTRLTPGSIDAELERELRSDNSD